MKPDMKDFIKYIKTYGIQEGSAAFVNKNAVNKIKGNMTENNINIKFVYPNSNKVKLGSKTIQLKNNDIYTYHRNNTLVLKKV